MGAEKEKVKVVCEYCGKELTIPFFKQRDRNYCGKKCRASHVQEVPCVTCGTIVTRSIHSTSKNVYCSNECRIDKPTPPLVKARCTLCGKRFMKRFYSAQKNTFCSRDCCNRWAGGERLRHRKEKGARVYEYPMAWTEELKSSIRDRDNHICQYCGQQEEGKSLSCHHIDYVKNNVYPGNIISLCGRCHAVTNGAREKWTEYFHKYMEEKYGYKY